MENTQGSGGKPKKKRNAPNLTGTKQVARNTSRCPASRIQKGGSRQSSPSTSRSRKIQPSKLEMSSSSQESVQEECSQGFHHSYLDATNPILPGSWHHAELNHQSLPANLYSQFSTFGFHADDQSSGYQISPEAISTTPDLVTMLRTPTEYLSNSFIADQASDSCDVPGLGFLGIQDIVNLDLDRSIDQSQFSRDIYPQANLPFAFDDFLDQTAHKFSNAPLPELSFYHVTTNREDDADKETYQEHKTLLLANENSRGHDEELVGLGLHDKAADTARQQQQLTRQSSTLLFNGPDPSVGKGLKLEETWEPPQQALTLLSSSVDAQYGYYDETFGDMESDPYLDQTFVASTYADPRLDYPIYSSDGRLILSNHYAEYMSMVGDKSFDEFVASPQEWLS